MQGGHSCAPRRRTTDRFQGGAGRHQPLRSAPGALAGFDVCGAGLQGDDPHRKRIHLRVSGGSKQLAGIDPPRANTNHHPPCSSSAEGVGKGCRLTEQLWSPYHERSRPRGAQAKRELLEVDATSDT